MNCSRQRRLLWHAVAALTVRAATAGCHRRAHESPAVAAELPASPSATEASEAIPDDRRAALRKTFAETPCYTVGELLHRWRVLAAFDTPQARAALEAELPLVCDHARYRAAFPQALPLFLESPSGFRVRQVLPTDLRSNVEGESHEYQCLCCLAEAGVAREHEIQVSASQRTTVGDLLHAAQRDWNSTNDPSWLLVASCRYAPESPTWRNRFGEATGLAEMARQLLQRPVGGGACHGTHAPYALAQFWVTFRDRTASGVSPRLVDDVGRELTTLRDRLVSGQHANGAWGTDWASSSAEGAAPAAADSIRDLVRVTSHHLEWLTLLPRDVQPDAAVLQSAATFLEESFSHAYVREDYCAYSHGVRALCRLARVP